MIRDFVINWFKDNSSLSGNELLKNMDSNYLELGIIDSFGFLALINVCEEKFKFQFSDDDFSDNNIFTINGLIIIIESKKI